MSKDRLGPSMVAEAAAAAVFVVGTLSAVGGFMRLNSNGGTGDFPLVPPVLIEDIGRHEGTLDGGLIVGGILAAGVAAVVMNRQENQKSDLRWKQLEQFDGHH